jgi:hypothetical protein
MDYSTGRLIADIRKFQRAQKRYPATSNIHADIGRMLAPLFAEMARRVSYRNGRAGYFDARGVWREGRMTS